MGARSLLDSFLRALRGLDHSPIYVCLCITFFQKNSRASWQEASLQAGRLWRRREAPRGVTPRLPCQRRRGAASQARAEVLDATALRLACDVFTFQADGARFIQRSAPLLWHACQAGCGCWVALCVPLEGILYGIL